MLKGSGTDLSKDKSAADLSLISDSGILSFDDDIEAVRIMAWKTVSEMARLRLGLRMDADSEDFEERLSELIEGAHEDSVGVGGSGISTGNEGRGRKTGLPKLKGLLRGDEGELSSSMGEKKLVSSPGHFGVGLESSEGKGEAWRRDSAPCAGITIDEDSSWTSIALSCSVGCSPGKMVGRRCSWERSNMFDKLGGGIGIIRELMSCVFGESIADIGAVGSFVELAKISRAEGRAVSERPGAVFLLAS